MREEARSIVIGAVLGALVGATAGWAYRRFGSPAESGEAEVHHRPGRAGGSGKGQLLKLVLAVLAVIRQISELR